MRILHTADWHIGRMLYGRKRYEEFSQFLEWLLEKIREESVEVLLIAGDVFDTATPSNRAQELYYQFLSSVGQTACRHIVVIGGNHDSPTFLDAPKQLLRAIDVHVVGAARNNIEEEVICLTDQAGKAEAIICAVPYLRDRDIRTVELGESVDDKNQKLITGIQEHYQKATDHALALKKELATEGNELPIIGMGHLFAAGGKAGEGVRDLYVGSLAHFPADSFPEELDYIALGHLHVPQILGGKEHIRYSGSSIPMGFGEAGQQKKVILIDWKDGVSSIRELEIPCFQELLRISGDLKSILAEIQKLKSKHSLAWLEIEYTGDEFVSDLRAQLESSVEGSSLEIRKVINLPIYNQVMKAVINSETLEDLDEHEVFDRCLDAYEVETSERVEMKALYAEVLVGMRNKDHNAE